MTNKELIKRIYHIATLEMQLEELYSKISEDDTVSDCTSFRPYKILNNCREENNCLYDSNGILLARDGLVDNLYYCNQYTGFCEDDYYGTMYYKTNKQGQFIAVDYNC